MSGRYGYSAQEDAMLAGEIAPHMTDGSPAHYNPRELLAALQRERHWLLTFHFAQAEDMREQRELRERLAQPYPSKLH